MQSKAGPFREFTSMRRSRTGVSAWEGGLRMPLRIGASESSLVSAAGTSLVFRTWCPARQHIAGQHVLRRRLLGVLLAWTS